MLHICLFLATVAAAPEEPSPGGAKPGDPRPLYEINRLIDALCVRDTQGKTESERAAAIQEMAVLYREILDDPRLPTSPTLKESRARLWSRLTRVKKEIQNKIDREARANRRADPVDALSPSELAQIDAISHSMAYQLSLVAASQGGPAAVFSQSGAAARGGRGIADFGPELVDLIQRTIQPDFWDVNGGPGTIVYYRPLMCLVVRATSEVHHQLGGGIGAIREAGK